MEEKSGFGVKTYCALIISGLLIIILDVSLKGNGILSILGFFTILVAVMPREDLKNSWRNDFPLRKV